MCIKDRSKHLRFFSVINELLPDMLERFTHHEYPISYALIATIMEGKSERQIGVARYMPKAVAYTHIRAQETGRNQV